MVNSIPRINKRYVGKKPCRKNKVLGQKFRLHATQNCGDIDHSSATTQQMVSALESQSNTNLQAIL